MLSNPRNVTLLTSHILTAPAIWSSTPSASLQTSLRVLTTFHNAAGHILRQETRGEKNLGNQFLPTEGITREEWIKAVVRGADERSPRWKHLLVLGGILTGFEAHNRQGLSFKTKEFLEEAVVTATNLSLQDIHVEPDLGAFTIILVLSHCFDILRPIEREGLDIDRLLPLLLKCLFFSQEGLQSGYFLSKIDSDIAQDSSNKFTWPERSASFRQTQLMATGPLVSTLGILSRVTAFCIENVQDTNLLFKAIGDLSAFSRSLSIQWRQNKLSELDISEEQQFLSQEALQKTIPLLWQVLKSAMFSTVIIQSSLISRALRDRKIPVTQMSFVAVQTLHTLRNLYFVSSRVGNTSFSQFNFVYTAAIDMLAQAPRQTEAFLSEIRPHEFGKLSSHPYERYLDLFFLNTAEHFTLILPQDYCEQVLLAAASPYLGTGGDQRLNEIFEAAHSVYLAVFSAPWNYAITIKHLPQYVDTLFSVFPHQLSARQLRLVVKTLIRTSSPPFRTAVTQPDLAGSILEMVRYRAIAGSSTDPLPALPSQNEVTEPVPMSEQSAFILAMIDSLPYLALQDLEEWLPLTAEALSMIRDNTLRETCQRRMWEVLSNGEMDVPRAEYSLWWWSSMGGKQAVLHGYGAVLDRDTAGKTTANL